jgi:hypothetical protein
MMQIEYSPFYLHIYLSSCSTISTNLVGLIQNLNGKEDLDAFLKINKYILFEGTETNLPVNV